MRLRTALPLVRVAAVTLPILFSTALACGTSEPPPPPPPPTKLAFVVRDALTDAPLAKAVLLFGPTLQRLETDASGRLEFEVTAGPHPYRAEAAGYLGVPRPYEGGRVAVAILEKTTEVPIALESRPGWTGGGSLAGRVTVAGSPRSGVLVHASASEDFSTWTDADGRYAFLGLPQGLYSVNALLLGHAATPRTAVDVVRGATVMGIDVTMAPVPGGRVRGTLAGATRSTTVALELAATGDVIPGLSAGVAADGPFQITGVPPGRFTVRAGFEQDGQTLDPDVLRTGMVPNVEITDTASTAALTLKLVPTVTGLVPSSTTTGALPRFTWNSFSGADFYVIEVRGADDRLVWGGFDARRNPAFRVRPLEVVYGDTVAALEQLAPGRAYRWRVYAAKDEPQLSSYRLLAGSEAAAGTFSIRR